MQICDYGCNKQAKFKFKTGKVCCESHYKKCPAERKRCSERTLGSKNGFYGKTHSDEYKNILKNNTGKNNPMFGKTHTKDVRIILSKKKMGNQIWKGRKHLDETKIKISKSNKGKQRNETIKNKMKILTSGKNNPMYGKTHSVITKEKMRSKAISRFKDKNFLSKWTKSITKKGPNKPEKLLLKILKELFGDIYLYTGDYTFWIEGKNPDFTNINDKKVIDYFGNWWHSEINHGIPEELEDKNRIMHFNKNDYKSLIIREHELNDIDSLKIKLLEFNNE